MSAEQATTLRAQQAELTRELILKAVAELLEDESTGEISVPDVARRSGVSLRTVYRYFPTREELLATAAEWINERMFGGVPFAQTVDDLPELMRSACERWDEHPRLARAMALSQAGRSVRSHRRVQRLAAVRQALANETGNLSEREQRRAFAVLGYLENMLAWVTMRDEAGLDGREVGEAIEWATRTLIADLRRRNTAADRAKGGRS
jgi:AcrR family transcriptional regulator